jgi:hypothetical protein
VYMRSGELKADLPLVVLAYAGKTAVPDDTKPHEDLVAAPGQLLRPGVAGVRVVASGQGVRAGTIVFDRSGALIGLLPADASPEKHIGDVVPGTHHALIDTATLTSFLGSKRPKEADSPIAMAAERSLGDIVAANRAAVVPVYCVP